MSQQQTTSATEQFDFWLGSWDVTWEGGGGTNTITRILDSRVIQEQFESPDLRGLSVSTFNERTGRWHQTWVDNQGSYLDFVGGWQVDGRMILSRTAEHEGQTIHQRMVWYDITSAALEWHWERSADGGKTWEVLWHISYRKQQ